MSATIRIYAIVRETEARLFVTTLTAREIDDNGDFGIEMLVKEWCDNRKLTFVDYAL